MTYTIVENAAPDSVTANIPAPVGGKLFGRVRATEKEAETAVTSPPFHPI